jgi:hypothetical protein
VIVIVVALGGFPISPKAAENGNYCCTSLEDRISKLEEKTKKDDDKVSVTVSGWVTKSVTGWSDGSEHHPDTPKE